MVLVVILLILSMSLIAYSLYNLIQHRQHFKKLFQPSPSFFYNISTLNLLQRKLQRNYYKLALAPTERNIRSFEELVYGMETQLSYISERTQSGQWLGINKSINSLMEDFEEKIKSMQNDIAAALAQSQTRPRKIHKRDQDGHSQHLGAGAKVKEFWNYVSGKSAPRHCHFCSRPLSSAKPIKIQTRVDQKVKKVETCLPCKSTLYMKKKVKILNFDVDGKAVHWSEYKEFRPKTSYWNLNFKPARLERRPRLSIVPAALRNSRQSHDNKSPSDT